MEAGGRDHTAFSRLQFTARKQQTSSEPHQAPKQVITSRSQEMRKLMHGQPRAKDGRSCGKVLRGSIGLCLLLLSSATTRAEAQTSGAQDNGTTMTTSPSSSPSSAGLNTSETATTPLAIGADLSLEPTPIPDTNSAAHKTKPINFAMVDELFQSSVNDSELLRHWKNMDGQFQEGIRSILKLVFPQIVAISQDAKVSGDCSGGILKWILSLRNLRSWAIKMLDATGKPTAGIFEGSLTMFGNHRQCLSIRAPDEDEIEITDQFEEYFRGQFCVLHLRPWLAAKRPFYHLNSSVDSLLRKNYKYYEKTLYDELAEIAIAFNFIDIRMDLCVPSTCTTADIQRVADLLSRKLEMRAKVMRCDIESRELSSTFVQSLDQTTKIWLAGPLCWVLITLVSSMIVVIRGNRANHRDNQATSGSTQIGVSSLMEQQSLTFDGLVYCMSIQGALNNLFSCPKLSPSGDGSAKLNEHDAFTKPTPLYGLRNIFIVWFVIVQLTIELKYQYLRESLVLRNMMLSYWPFQIIINTSMIFESLILITAFTYAYRNWNTTSKSLLGYIVTKYIRLMPSIVTLIMATIVLPSIGITSPVWRNFVETQSNVCKSTGYLDLFFLQNFVSYDKICLPHTWLFCVEFQLIALSLPIVLVLQRALERANQSKTSSDQDLASVKGGWSNKRHHVSNSPTGDNKQGQRKLLTPKMGLLGLVLVLMGAGGNFVLVYVNQLPPAWFHTFPDAEQKEYYFSMYLTKTWTHLSTFIIGLYAGHLARAGLSLQLTSQPDKYSSNTDTSGSEHSQIDRTTTTQIAKTNWCGSIWHTSLQLVALGCLGCVIFLTYNWSTWELPSPLVAGLYDSVSRLVWSIALASLMIQLCRPNSKTGAYSGLSRLFSQPSCIVLGRLSFLAYLIAPLVHTFVLAVQEQSLFPSLYLIFHVILGNIVITYLLAFVLSIMIEQPIRLVLRRLSFRTRGRASISTANVTTTTSSTSLAN